MSIQPPPDYLWWVDYKGIWELKQAADLYLGFNPDRGGLFDAIDDLLAKHDRGLILTDSETVWSVGALSNPKSGVEWDDVFDKDGNSKISLEAFIIDRIAAGEIKDIHVGGDSPSGLYFKPSEIITLFQKHLLNKPPQDLLTALGIDVSQKKATRLISQAALNSAYKKHVHDNEQKRIIPTWEEDWIAMESILGKRPTQAQIKDVRAKLAPSHWKQRGRRKTS